MKQERTHWRQCKREFEEWRSDSVLQKEADDSEMEGQKRCVYTEQHM